MIVAVTGGRDTVLTPEAARAFGRCLWRLGGVRVLRVGCARGLDAAIHTWSLALPAGYTREGARSWATRRWVADWGNETGKIPGEPRKGPRGHYWPAAGHARNRGMLSGDPSAVLRVEPVGPGLDTAGQERGKRADLLVAWPGGKGTADCVDQARRSWIQVTTIEDLIRG
jgi:hypothetical protein